MLSIVMVVRHQVDKESVLSLNNQPFNALLGFFSWIRGTNKKLGYKQKKYNKQQTANGKKKIISPRKGQKKPNRHWKCEQELSMV